VAPCGMCAYHSPLRQRRAQGFLVCKLDTALGNWCIFRCVSTPRFMPLQQLRYKAIQHHRLLRGCTKRGKVLCIEGQG